MKESITPYDILRYHDQAILVYDFKGNEIGLNQTRKEFQSPGKARYGFYSNCNKREQFSSVDIEESPELNSYDLSL
ncbi:hypothetical protein [Legionella nautarum]|uniref:hypothetical protein n=1 Tax=Legionella nautarum TaxID=45070 RepID=UPI001056A92D|nr:hypothetical protein [Legionella nautarum]